jgi:hypothetical protein
MASFNKIQAFAEHVYEGVHNLGSNTLKVLLTNDAPSAAADAVKADLTSELSTANGYTAGGTAPSISSSAQTSGTYKLVLADSVFTASGGTLGPFRYAILYDDTATNNELIGYWDYGSSITLQDGETFTVDFDATNGVLQLA